jgi:hypothetical protein
MMKGLNASVDMKGSECSPSPKLNMEKKSYWRAIRNPTNIFTK